MTSTRKIKTKDTLEEVDLGDMTTKRLTYISSKIYPHLKSEVIKVLRKLRDCFAWDYDEMFGLIHELVEL